MILHVNIPVLDVVHVTSVCKVIEKVWRGIHFISLVPRVSPTCTRMKE